MERDIPEQITSLRRRHLHAACLGRADYATAGVPELREAELGLVPHADCEEAVQEAWLAHVSGRSPARAVNTFAKREGAACHLCPVR